MGELQEPARGREEHFALATRNREGVGTPVMDRVGGGGDDGSDDEGDGVAWGGGDGEIFFRKMGTDEWERERRLQKVRLK